MSKTISKKEVMGLVDEAAFCAYEQDANQDIRFKDGRLYIIGHEAEDGGDVVISNITAGCGPEWRWKEVEGGLEFEGFEITE